MRFRRRENKRRIIIRTAIVAALAICVISGIGFALSIGKEDEVQPEDTLYQYADYMQKGDYASIYTLLDDFSKEKIAQEELVERYENIYGGIEAVDITFVIDTVFDEQERKEQKKKKDIPVSINYTIAMETLAGPLTIPSCSILRYSEEEKTYKMSWDREEIFPGLKENYKVSVKTSYAERGNIYDRNDEPLAYKGDTYSVGVVPGKLEEPRDEAYKKISDVLGVSVEKIEKELSAGWVKDDLFVPLRTISPNNEELKNALLEIPGVMLSTIEERIYPYGNEMAHVLGYVQSITAEELEKKAGERYNATSIIGKSGIERAFEDKLRSRDGYEVVVVDENGEEVSTILTSQPANGYSLYLTINSVLQKNLYEQLQDDKGCAVAMNPKTGEVLALVSTPAFDSNDFTFGYTQAAWQEINEDENQPLYNRLRGTWVPGSSIKPVIGALAVEAGTLNPEEDVKNEGLSWKNNESWGNYEVTTLSDYDNKNLQNALIYSDNIYFAKAAVGMGPDVFTESLTRLGFAEEIPFELSMNASTISNEGSIADEIQLADSGYGQGQLLINPLHLASIYSAFYNEGSMIQPHLEKDIEPEFWKENVFSKETADMIRNDMIKIVESENGTAHEAAIEGMTLAAKTGTAEMKADKNDESGTELGWFVCMTADERKEPILIVMMIEDVKDRGGSHYVIPKVKTCIEQYYEYKTE